jgi:hypothetical protein
MLKGLIMGDLAAIFTTIVFFIVSLAYVMGCEGL